MQRAGRLDQRKLSRKREGVRPAIRRRGKIVRAQADEAPRAVSPRRHLAWKQIHLRRADKASDEDIRGGAVDFHRLVELLEDAVVHDRDAVRHHHRLLLVVRDEDDGDFELALQPLDLGARFHPQARVEVGERFVHKERRRMPNDSPPHRDALSLAARQLRRRALEERVEPEQIGGPGDLGRDRLFLGLLLAQGKGQIFANRHVRIERIVLEHERDVSVARRHSSDVAGVEHDSAVGNLLKARDAEEKGALPAARWPDERNEAAVGNFEVERVQDGRCPVALADAFDGDRAHGVNPSPRRTARPGRGNAGRRRRPARGKNGQHACGEHRAVFIELRLA